MSVHIRQAVYSDIPYLYQICLKTGNCGKDASALFSDPYIIGQYYAATYVFYDPSFCFIAENDLVSEGYILATANTVAFNTWMETEWLPLLRRRYPLAGSQKESKSQAEKNITALIHRIHIPAEDPWQTEYPAHLHIDLLPSIQGKGNGRMLMATLFEKLNRMHCPGIQLGVDRINTGAIAFYKKLGFSVLKEKSWGFQMGKKIFVIN